MIPTLILLGLILGRWPLQALLACSLGWALLLALDGIISTLPGLLAALLFAAGNAALGVGIYQLGRFTLRAARRVRSAD